MMASLDIRVQPSWPTVREIRQRVAQLLAEFPEAVRAATVMTASELVENAIKYGEALPRSPGVSLSLVASARLVRLDVANGTTNVAGVRELRERIDAIGRAVDRAALYFARLEQLLESPGETGKLGLYRIAFEGAFDLSCSYEEQVVTVTATREVA